MAGGPVGRRRTLPDILAPGLRVVFVGINPSLASARAGHHFASPGNPFWRLLHAAGFTPEVLRPAEDGRLLELGIGITNVCPRPTRSAAELTRREYERGVVDLVRKLELVRSAAIALVGVRPEAWRSLQNGLPGLAKWWPTRADSSDGLMPTNTRRTPGARTSGTAPAGSAG